MKTMRKIYRFGLLPLMVFYLSQYAYSQNTPPPPPDKETGRTKGFDIVFVADVSPGRTEKVYMELLENTAAAYNTFHKSPEINVNNNYHLITLGEDQQLSATAITCLWPGSNNLFDDEPGSVKIVIKRKAKPSTQNKIGCTPGELHVNGTYFCCTLEKPFKNAEQNISSIHPGIYNARLVYSRKKNQWRIQLQPITTYGYDHDPFVPNRRIHRNGIQIHPGTKPQHSRGCILVGLPGNNRCQLRRSHEVFDRLLENYFGSSIRPDQSIKITVVIRAG